MEQADLATAARNVTRVHKLPIEKILRLEIQVEPFERSMEVSVVDLRHPRGVAVVEEQNVASIPAKALDRFIEVGAIAVQQQYSPIGRGHPSVIPFVKPSI
jgi:hypothetical protein